ncbi:flagellar motor control protein ZomB [Nocardia sp. 348MFTsu5.1]|uniref:flagellar motor control protein ZomB n=1 Tax=Nocardia sp. 348MFTsu5.1 TaxID=1172185 RepID=UPI00037FCDE7|nr:flagellar motor control protein ZomB [Nocardia sp. 348MFTsu5.1]
MPSVEQRPIVEQRPSARPQVFGRRIDPATTSLAISAVVVAVMFGYGAWQRRWIADDGLIVLRTVRNLLAGNGPVFNKGERVEANTSTVWTYLIWFWSWVTGGQTEYVVLWIALVLSIAAVPLAMYGTGRLYRIDKGVGPVNRGAMLLLPLGALVYIALPPARDFATSGLEVSLCIFWAALLWCQLVAWSQRETSTGRLDRTQTITTLLLGFTAGLAPLIRPELTLVGGCALLLVVCAPMTWRMRLAFAAAAGTVPVLYQIFRMGYYGLLVPNTAVAKDASGSKFEQGFRYLGNMFSPYLLLLPLIVAVVAAAVTWYLRRRQIATAADAAATGPIDLRKGSGLGARAGAFSRRLQTPSAVVALIVVTGLIEAFYWVRQGGDFMHARVLLVPLFLLMLPVMVIPITIPTGPARDQLAGWIGAGVMTGLWVTTVVWAISTSSVAGMTNGTEIGRGGIVDERRYYIQNIGIEHPITAEDYLGYPRVRAMVESIAEHQDTGGVLLPSPNYDEWYFDPLPVPPPEGVAKQLSVFYLNLGMTSMNAPLDVRVIDQMGLAYPIAAHSDRLTDGRIGHDKDLDPEWVVAESGAFPRYPVLPPFIDQDGVKQAQVALTCKPTQDLIASYSAPWTFERFRHNLRQAVGFTSYRIDRNPLYELQRCNLPIPEPVP